jgi:hypothetical protein
MKKTKKTDPEICDIFLMNIYRKIGGLEIEVVP